MKKLILSIGLLFCIILSYGQTNRDVNADRVIVRDSVIMTNGKVTDMAPGTANKDAINRQQLVDSVAKYSFVEPRDSILFSNDISSLVHQEGKFYYDSLRQTWIGYIAETDVTFEFMYEDWIRIYNNTGQTITNTQVCYMNGVILDGLNTPTVALANAKWDSTSQSALGFATHNIEPGTYGELTKSGTVRDAVTNLFTSGARILLDTIDGGYTNIPPQSPNYLVSLGNIGRSDASDGTIEVHIDIGNNTRGVINIFNGAEFETLTVDVFSDGTTSKVALSCATSNEISVFFDGQFVRYAVPDTITLTNGTDTVPVRNWVYIPNSTRVLTLNTTGVSVTNGFPTNEQYVGIVDVITPSAATAQTEGFNKVHVWTDHISNSVGQGHLSDVNFWIRKQNATYQTGISLTTNPLEDVFGAQIDLSTTSGDVLQLHTHTYPAKNTATGDVIKVYNDPDTANWSIPNLNSTVLSQDSEGGSLGNRYYTVTLFGIVSEDAEDCQYFLKLPSGSYSNASSALSDLSEYTNKLLPIEYKGTAFLMYALTLQNSGGNIKVVSGGVEDLRESASEGGGQGSPGVTTYDELDDTPPNKTGSSNKLVGVNVGETAHEYKPITVDASGNVVTAGEVEANSLSINSGNASISSAGAGVFTSVDANLTNGKFAFDNSGVLDNSVLEQSLQELFYISSGANANFNINSPTGYQSQFVLSANGGTNTFSFLTNPSATFQTSVNEIIYRSDNGFNFRKTNNTQLFGIDNLGNTTAEGTATAATATLGSHLMRLEQATNGTLSAKFLDLNINDNASISSAGTADINGIVIGKATQTLAETAGAITFDYANGANDSTTIDQTTVITMSNVPDGGAGEFVIVQGDAGDDNVTFVHTGLTVKWRDNDQDLTDTSGAIDVLSYKRMSNTLYITFGKNYTTQ